MARLDAQERKVARMVKATYKGREVLSVLDFDEATSMVWFVVEDNGTALTCWSSARNIVLEAE